MTQFTRQDFWQVGDLTEGPSHTRYYDEQTAIEKARSLSAVEYTRPIAVWDERLIVVHLFLCDEQFRKV